MSKAKNTKKTEVKKNVNKQNQEVKEQEVEETVTQEVEADATQNEARNTESQVERRVRKKLDENLLVPIASGVRGGLTYISRDGNVVLKFAEYNDEDVIELRDLRRMMSQNRKFLQRGWIRVLDPEVVEYLNLERFQKDVVEPEDLEGLLDKDPEQIREIIETAGVNAKRLIYGYAKEKYINGELTNIHVIQAIEKGIGESLDPNNK